MSDEPQGRLVALIALELVVVRAALIVSNLATVRQLAEIVVAICSPRSVSYSPDIVGETVEMVADRLPKTTCLSTAITTDAILRTAGFESKLKIGVRRQDDDLAAHAWVETQERIVVGGNIDLTDYDVLVADKGSV